jgi:DNA ligase-associated metallophosphoesterase
MTICLAGQEVYLRPSGAAVVGGSLVVADLHLGKERAFRQHGLAVPDGPTAEALHRLSGEVEEAQARRLVFLGDLFHHADAIAGVTFDALRDWREKRPWLEVLLVQGNHDRIPAELRDAIATSHSLTIGELALFHHPKDPSVPHLAGHLHPAVLITDGPDTERVRCFWRHRDRLILPSFSAFTGCATVTPARGDEVFIPVGASVRRLACKGF